MIYDFIKMNSNLYRLKYWVNSIKNTIQLPRLRLGTGQYFLVMDLPRTTYPKVIF